MNLIEVQDRASKCTACELHTERKIPVFATGNPFAKLMICGMCPGPDENSLDNEMGWPFIGRSGRQLDEILEDVELTQKDVYITNVVKCYLKPGNRLTDVYIDSCLPYLIEQVGAIEPKIILALGADAGRALLNKPKSASLDSMRGKRYKFTENISIIVTYHPSFFVRLGGRKHKYYHRIIEDMKWVKEILNR